MLLGSVFNAQWLNTMVSERGVSVPVSRKISNTRCEVILLPMSLSMAFCVRLLAVESIRCVWSPFFR
jgi:hypothetical protein